MPIPTVPTLLPGAAGPIAGPTAGPTVGPVGPNWFATVMGTGIVAMALDGLPFAVPGATYAATAVWLLAALLLVAVTTVVLGQTRRHPGTTRAHLHDPVLSHFYGAPAMALMTVGAGAVLVGHRVIGAGPALVADVVLWTAGTVLGLVTATLVPVTAFTRGGAAEDAASGGWLMPVVPPMVSAATGALLVPHLPAGEPRETLLLVCYLLFGLSLMASLVILPLIWQRLVRHGVGAAAAVPTLWIVLGPLGQSITAAHHLGEVAPDVLPAPYGEVFAALTLVYGVPVWGFALMWLVVAGTLTTRAARAHLPFSLTWWSFTFPVGTLVTGTSGLAAATDLVVLEVAAGVLCLGLLLAWVLVASRTLRWLTGGLVSRTPGPARLPVQTGRG